MRLRYFLLITLVSFCSCLETEKEYLDDVCDNLLQMSSVKYTTHHKSIVDGDVVFEHSDTVSFDFQKDNPHDLKYHLNSEESELIFNGFELFQSINDEQIITTSKNDDPEYFNNPLFLSISYVRNILPKLINDKRVSISRGGDTIINSIELYTYNLLLEKAFVHPVNYEFIEAEINSLYSILINKSNNLPYRIISPNGENGTSSNTFINVELDVKFDASLWKGETLPKDYTMITEEEYFENRNNDMTSHIGESFTKWELSNLIDNAKVDLSQFKGSVLLLDFWFKGCYGCLLSIPQLNEINSKFANDDFKIFGIEYDERASRENLLKYIKENNVEYSNLYEGKKLALKYGITIGPTFMIIDKRGKIIHIKSGSDEDHMRELERIIKKNI